MAKYILIKEFSNSPDLGTITEFPTGNSWSEYWKLIQEEKLNVPFGTKFKTTNGTQTIYTVSKIVKNQILITWEKDTFGRSGNAFYTIEDVNSYFEKGTWIKYEEPILKVGDTVILFKHKEGSYYTSKIGSIDTIKEFLNENIGVYLVNAVGFWYTEDCRLATSEEIEKFKEVKIDGYILEMNNGLAEFGCQSFTKSELQAYRRLVREPIDGRLVIGGTIINTELLDKILDRF
jgi:hypothetical protein